MEQNYRSTQNILGIANALIEHNVHRKPKSLWTEAGNGDLAVLYRAEDEHDEAFFVADEIERLRQTEGFRYGDVAVFYRTNAQSRVIEDVLMRVGAPIGSSAASGSTSAREIKDVLGYLRLLLNPQDVISFRRVVNMPKRGIGDATVSAVESFAREEGITVIDAARRVDEIVTLAARAKGAVAGFVQVMDALQGIWTTAPARRGWSSSPRRSRATWPSSRRIARSRRRVGSRTCRRSPASPPRSWRASPTRISPGSWSRSRSSASRTSTTRKSPSSR